MYLPEHFKARDLAQAYALMSKYPFGMVVTVTDDEPFISHVPFHVDATRGEISWHLAAANPQVQQLVAGAATKLVFVGPHAYISPRWYTTAAVPTWNYAAVHVTGTVHALDQTPTAALVAALSRVYEGPTGLGDFESAPRYVAMTHAIRGFTLLIGHVSSKFKLSQNRPVEDQQQVISALQQSTDQNARETAQLMTDTLRATTP